MSLQRFIDAQQHSYDNALLEIKSGRKTSHWMWYIFPQIRGLGFSETSKFYAIQDIQEATAYIQHPLLGTRLVEISAALLIINNKSAREIFGTPDDMKLKSSMTLFAAVPKTSPVLQQVLDKYFNGDPDQATLELIK
jgi:uncharacterized protein (DUF1810 family)